MAVFLALALAVSLTLAPALALALALAPALALLHMLQPTLPPATASITHGCRRSRLSEGGPRMSLALSSLGGGPGLGAGEADRLELEAQLAASQVRYPVVTPSGR